MKKFTWQIGLENLTAAYEVARKELEAERDQFLAPLRDIPELPIDWKLVSALEEPGSVY